MSNARDALRKLRAEMERLTHPEAKMRRLLRDVEAHAGAAARALDKARGGPQ